MKMKIYEHLRIYQAFVASGWHQANIAIDSFSCPSLRRELCDNKFRTKIHRSPSFSMVHQSTSWSTKWSLSRPNPKLCQDTWTDWIQKFDCIFLHYNSESWPAPPLAAQEWSPRNSMLLQLSWSWRAPVSQPVPDPKALRSLRTLQVFLAEWPIRCSGSNFPASIKICALHKKYFSNCTQDKRTNTANLQKDLVRDSRDSSSRRCSSSKRVKVGSSGPTLGALGALGVPGEKTEKSWRPTHHISSHLVTSHHISSHLVCEFLGAVHNVACVLRSPWLPPPSLQMSESKCIASIQRPESARETK